MISTKDYMKIRDSRILGDRWSQDLRIGSVQELKLNIANVNYHNRYGNKPQTNRDL